MPQFTKEQEKAINDRGHDILVSASAGSGKTTVLVERVLREILAGTQVSELLVVTFTKAAAEEMKTRIKNALTQEMAKPGVNRRYLREQLNQVDTANISTIDAFCLEVIHRFYYSVDLDPGFQILTDETQAALLKERALREVEGDFLTNKDSDFRRFYDNFAGDRDADSPRDLLLDLYNYAMAKPEYHAWLMQLPEVYETGAEITQSNLWQNQIKPYLLDSFKGLENKINGRLEETIFETKELKKVREDFSLFDQNLQNFLAALDEDKPYDEQRDLLRLCTFNGRYRKSSKWDEDLLEFYGDLQKLKDEAKSQVFDTFTAFFATDEKEQVKVMQDGQKIVAAIAQAEIALIERFNKLKRDEDLIDYSDMEQLAYRILSQDTSSSQMARDFYQSKFKEILVDEYQDINALQENIIQQVRQPGKNTLFMVGDVKQSIYGFRQAEPSLFLRKYHDFAQEQNEHEERILLSDNFRSTEPVTRTVNHLFNSILSSNFGGIDYQKEGQLVFGAKYYPSNLPKASEVIIHKKERGGDENSDKVDFSEIQMVLARIKQLKEEHMQVFDSKSGQMREMKYSDIAILTRSHSDNLEIMQEFAKQDIPLFVTDAENYFQTFELTVIMNYLKIIDNPDQDIPLVTVLRSPLFNFGEKDLAKIRIKSKNSSFYSALTSYVGVGDQLSDKCKDFLNQLASLREFATTHRISELIWSIYTRTNLLEIMTALPNGEQRRVNLEALYERATSYESAGFKVLYQFINFINRMRQSQKDLAQPLLTKEAGNAVRLMTIHGSKGLEFPIVFYLGMHHQYQLRDLKGNYVINADGLGVTLREEHYRIDSLVKAMGNITKKRQLLEEEARILYVALTRAKQKLIMVGDIPSFDKKVKDWSNELDHEGQLSLADKLAATTPLSFMGPALAFDRRVAMKISDITNSLDQSQPILFVDFSDDDAIANNAVNEEKETRKDSEPEIKKLTETATKLYQFDYPFKDAIATTAYQAVSEIKKAFNDPDEAELENSHLLASTNRYLQPIDTKPSFLYQTKFTGAEIGTATHLILQYYDYTGDGSDEQLEQEIQHLIEQKKLNADIVSSLKKDQIEWFVHSDFAKDFWQRPEDLKREVDFSSLLSARTLFDDFSDPNAKILVHGTIDGYFIINNGIILFDYKTDHVDKSHLDEAIELIKEKYTGQLRLYERALNEFSTKKVIGKYLILLDAKQAVEVK